MAPPLSSRRSTPNPGSRSSSHLVVKKTSLRTPSLHPSHREPSSDFEIHQWRYPKTSHGAPRAGAPRAGPYSSICHSYTWTCRAVSSSSSSESADADSSHHNDEPSTSTSSSSDEDISNLNNFQRRMRTFTLPALGIYVSGPLLSLVDTSIVGLNSPTELAALGPSTVLCDVSLFFFNALATAATSLVAASLVNGERRETSSVVLCGVQVGAVAGTILMAILMVFPRTLLNALGAPAATIEPALAYTSIRALSVPFQVVAMVTSSCILGKGNAYGPLRATAIAAVVNLVGDIVLCLGPPQMGIRGAAIATTASVILQCLLMLRQTYAEYLFPFEWYAKSLAKRVRIMASGVFARPSKQVVANFFTYMGPLSFILLTRVCGFTTSAAAAAAYGTTTLAAHQVLFSVFNFLIVFGQPISQTAMTFLPSAIGAARADAAKRERDRMLTTKEGRNVEEMGIGIDVEVPDYGIPVHLMNDKPRKTTEKLTLLSFFVGIGLAAVAAILLLVLPGAFTNDAIVISMLRTNAPIVCIGLAILPMNIVMDGVFVAMGKLRTVMVFTTCTLGVQMFWLITGMKLGYGLPGIWTAQLWRLAVFNLLCFAVLFSYGLLGARDPEAQRKKDDAARDKYMEALKRKLSKNPKALSSEQKGRLRAESEAKIRQELADDYRKMQGLSGELVDDDPQVQEAMRKIRDAELSGSIEPDQPPPSLKHLKDN